MTIVPTYKQRVNWEKIEGEFTASVHHTTSYCIKVGERIFGIKVTEIKDIPNSQMTLIKGIR